MVLYCCCTSAIIWWILLEAFERANWVRICVGWERSVVSDHCSINFLLLRCILLGHGITSRLQGTTAQRLAAQHQQHLQWGVQKPWEPIKRPSAVTACVDSFPTGSFTNFSISNPNCLNYYPAFRNLLLAWLSETFQARTCNVVFSQAVTMHVGSVVI
jgi:hypothetical protein